MTVRALNFFDSTLANPLGSTDLSLTVVSAGGFTINPGEISFLTIMSGTQREIVRVSSVTTNTFTITGRAQDGTAAQSFQVGARVICAPVHGFFARLLSTMPLVFLNSSIATGVAEIVWTSASGISPVLFSAYLLQIHEIAAVAAATGDINVQIGHSGSLVTTGYRARTVAGATAMSFLAPTDHHALSIGPGQHRGALATTTGSYLCLISSAPTVKSIISFGGHRRADGLDEISVGHSSVPFTQDIDRIRLRIGTGAVNLVGRASLYGIREAIF